ncbi:hypothetical protein CYY_007056 [Polysphondylium violaceum]|uniref:Uncharacterized protein n=1 Tax=Polysphondylium violaceum TaxID=133409 RepID=A0A8J4PRH8_9MYCE|nr:hypothetical protein CYY_007056 [Polysphondylium violaceum]
MNNEKSNNDSIKSILSSFGPSGKKIAPMISKKPAAGPNSISIPSTLSFPKRTASALHPDKAAPAPPPPPPAEAKKKAATKAPGESKKAKELKRRFEERATKNGIQVSKISTDPKNKKTKYEDISLDDLLKDKRDQKSLFEDIDLDYVKPSERKDSKKEKKTVFDSNVLDALNETFDQDQIKNIQSSISSQHQDLLLNEYPNQQCIKNDIPKLSPMTIKDIDKQTEKHPIFNLLSNIQDDEAGVKAFLMNSSMVLFNNGKSPLPKSMIEFFYSFVCHGFDDNLSYKAFEFLRLYCDKYPLLISFQQFITTFKEYKIFNLLHCFNDDSFSAAGTNSLSKKKVVPTTPFPLMKFNSILSLIRKCIKSFSTKELKDMSILFILFSIDPKFLDKNPTFHKNIDKRINSSKIFAETFVDRSVNLSVKESIFSGLGELLAEYTLKTDYDISKLYELFEDLDNTLESTKTKMSLRTVISQNIPFNCSKIPVQRCYSLYSISKILEKKDIISIISNKNIADASYNILEPMVSRIRNNSIDIHNMINIVQLFDICTNNREELNRQTYEKIDKLLTVWNSKIKESKDFDFTRTRIKDLLILIQSKIVGISQTLRDYSTKNFFSPVKPKVSNSIKTEEELGKLADDESDDEGDKMDIDVAKKPEINNDNNNNNNNSSSDNGNKEKNNEITNNKKQSKNEDGKENKTTNIENRNNESTTTTEINSEDTNDNEKKTEDSNKNEETNTSKENANNNGDSNNSQSTKDNENNITTETKSENNEKPNNGEINGKNEKNEFTSSNENINNGNSNNNENNNNKNHSTEELKDTK